MADQDFNIKVVTTADTSGLRQTSAEMDAIARRQAEAEAKWARSPINPKNQTGGSGRGEVTSGLGSFAAPTALIAIGYEFVSQLSRAAVEIQKISDELNKQGAQIVDNALKFSELAKFSTTTADVIKIGEGALKGVEAAHKNLLDISSRELSVWQKIADVWAAGFKDKGPIAQALELQQAQAAQNYEMERNNAIHEISLAQYIKSELAARGYADKVEYLTEKIKESEDAQRRAGVSNVEDYLKAGKEAENFRQILEGVNSERRKEIAGAGDRTKQILKNEELAREARKYGREEQAAALDVGTRALKESATAQEMAEYKRASGQDEAESRTRKNQEALDKELERQRAEPTASYKTAEQIGRENAERAAAEANERAGIGKPTEPLPSGITSPPPQAQPSAAPTPSPDVVQAIHNLEAKFDRYWS